MRAERRGSDAEARAPRNQMQINPGERATLLSDRNHRDVCATTAVGMFLFESCFDCVMDVNS